MWNGTNDQRQRSKQKSQLRRFECICKKYLDSEWLFQKFYSELLGAIGSLLAESERRDPARDDHGKVVFKRRLARNWTSSFCDRT